MKVLPTFCALRGDWQRELGSFFVSVSISVLFPCLWRMVVLVMAVTVIMAVVMIMVVVVVMVTVTDAQICCCLTRHRQEYGENQEEGNGHSGVFDVSADRHFP